MGKLPSRSLERGMVQTEKEAMPPFLASLWSIAACPEATRPREAEGRDRAAGSHSSPTYLL